jgi:hypothetical protein
MNFPDDMKEILNSEYIKPNTTKFDLLGTRLLSRKEERRNQSLLEVKVISYDNDSFSENFVRWKVSNVTSRLITIDLEFLSPIQVSQGDLLDTVYLFISFANITDIYGSSLPEFEVITKQIPRLMGSKAEAAAIEAIGTSLKYTSTAIVSSNFLVNLLLTASLNGLWSMLNSA